MSSPANNKSLENNKPKCTPTRKNRNIDIVSAFISKASTPDSESQISLPSFSSPSPVALLIKSSKRSSGNDNSQQPASNFAVNSTSTSEKRKRNELIMGPTNVGAKIRKIGDESHRLKSRVLECQLPPCGCGEEEIFKFFKDQIVAEKATKVRLARMLNDRINESIENAKSIRNIVDNANQGLESGANTFPIVLSIEETDERFNISPELIRASSKSVSLNTNLQLNQAYELAAEKKKSLMYKSALDCIIIECNRLNTNLGKLKLPKATIHQVARESKPTASMTPTKYKSVKRKQLNEKSKKVLFASPIDDRFQQTSSSKNTSKIEIEIPGKQSIEANFLLKGQIDENIKKIQTQLAKFKTEMKTISNEIDFDTFNISQEPDESSTSNNSELTSLEHVPDNFPGITTNPDIFAAKNQWEALKSQDQAQYEQDIKDFYAKNAEKDSKNDKN